MDQHNLPHSKIQAEVSLNLTLFYLLSGLIADDLMPIANKSPRTSAAGSGVQVFERADLLLGILAAQSAPVTLKALSAQTGLNISTVHRILGALHAIGLVEHQVGGLYRLGLRWLEYGNLVRERLQIREVARPWIDQLHETIGEPVNLAIRDGDDIIYLDRAAANAARIRVVYRVGSRAPLHLTSLGKLFLAEDSANEISSYAKRTGLPGNTEHSLTTMAQLNKALNTVRATGIAFDNEEAELGLRCVAAPVRNDRGTLVGAISVSSPSDRFREHEAAWVPALKACADQISRALGARL